LPSSVGSKTLVNVYQAVEMEGACSNETVVNLLQTVCIHMTD